MPELSTGRGNALDGDETNICAPVAGLAKNAKLLGNDAHTSALVTQWVEWADDEVLNKAINICCFKWGFVPYFKPLDIVMHEKIASSLSYLEATLAKKTFLVGHRLTLADIVVASNLQFLFTSLYGAQTRSKYPNVQRFYQTIFAQPGLKDIAPAEALLAEDWKFQAPKKEKAPKPAAAPAPKKEKAAPKPADDEEQEAPKPKPTKNPLDDLPKSSFIVDEWKRVYSNKDTKTEAIPWFYQNFDWEGWSIVKFRFRYPEDLTAIFMSSNLIGGFFNRLEASRKYLMGTGGVFGEANNSEIQGVFILRGSEWKPVLSVAPDIESYDVTPLDIRNNEEDKKYFEGMLEWELSVPSVKGEPLAYQDGKILK